MKYAFAITLALALAACGDTYNAPPAANGTKPANIQQPKTPGKQPTGPSRAKEFNEEAIKAQAAWKAFAKDKTAENYAICGAHIYRALAYKFGHEDNGHEASALRGSTELNRLKKDWTGTEGQLTSEQKQEYREHPEFKAAFEEYQKVQR